MKSFTFIFNGHASAGVGLSGGEEHCFQLLKLLHSKGYTTNVCCPDNYPNQSRLKNAKSFFYPSIPHEEKYYAFFPILFLIYCYRILRTIKVLQKIDATYVIASSHLFHDIVPTLFITSKKQYITYIHHIIGMQNRGGISSHITRFLEKISFYIIKKLNYLVFVDSLSTKNILYKKYNFNLSNLFVTKNGIDIVSIKNIKINSQPKYDLCYCGRLRKSKGIYDLLEMINLVKINQPNVTCAVIGVGKEQSRIIQKVREMQLSANINLLGFLSERKKIETIKSSKLFVLPSHEEGWGIVIGEAMASGVPVIAYGLPDIIDIWKEGVRWVECFNIKAFAKYIDYLIRNDNYRRTFILKGNIIVESLDWNNILESEIIQINSHWN